MMQDTNQSHDKNPDRRDATPSKRDNAENRQRTSTPTPEGVKRRATASRRGREKNHIGSDNQTQINRGSGMQ
jgi:hypothetical protein